MRSGGFTVLELLVTIVIAMIVVMLLVPALHKGEMAQQRLDCATQLRNDGMATWQYTTQHRGRFPPFYATKEIGAPGSSKIKISVKAKKNSESGLSYLTPSDMVCPTDLTPGTIPIKLENNTDVQVPLSYGYNIGLPMFDARTDGLKAPAATIVLFDGTVRTTGNVGNGNSPVQFYDSVFQYAQQTARFRHDQKVNALYADWHIAPVAPLTAPMFGE